MKANTDANRRMSKRFFYILIGILLCTFILSTSNAEAADNGKTIFFPTSVIGDSASGFEGGTCPAPYSDVNNIDIEKAFIGKERESLFVAIPAGRFIHFLFPADTNELASGTLVIETTGADKAKGEAYALLNDNTELMLGSIYETQATQKTTFSLDEDCLSKLRSIRIDGTNNAGQYAGLDVVSVYIESDNMIYFDPQKGTADYKSKIVLIGDTYGPLPNAWRTGYTFKGWYTEKSGGSKISSSDVRDSSADTLYAHWTAHKYNVKFNKNGGSGSMESRKNLEYGKKYTLKKNKFTRKGYTFKGWSTSKKGTIKYTDKANIWNLTTKHKGTVTLYAIWQKPTVSVKYTISYNANGGKGNMKPTSCRTKATYILRKNTFKRTGYTFIGWSTKRNGTVQYGDQAAVRDLSTKARSTKVLYAVWVKNTKKEEIKKAQSKVPQVYGLVIGGCNSDEEGQYTKEETIDVWRKLRKNKIGGYKTIASNIKKKVVEGDQAPTRELIDKWIPSAFIATTDDDISFVYYAGHGDGGGPNGTGQGICLRTEDGGTDFYRYEDFINLLDESIKGKIVLMVDACFSEGFVTAAKQSGIKNRIAVFASSEIKEFSRSDYKALQSGSLFAPVTGFWECYIINGKGYHQFTYALMKGLNWNKTQNYPADINKDKAVTCEELSAYIGSNISASVNWKIQTPKCYLGKLKNQIIFSY